MDPDVRGTERSPMIVAVRSEPFGDSPGRREGPVGCCAIEVGRGRERTGQVQPAQDRQPLGIAWRSGPFEGAGCTRYQAVRLGGLLAADENVRQPERRHRGQQPSVGMLGGRDRPVPAVQASAVSSTRPSTIAVAW